MEFVFGDESPRSEVPEDYDGLKMKEKRSELLLGGMELISLK